MWPPVIWIGKWLVKEAVLTVAAHYATKFVKKKLKGEDDAEEIAEGSGEETEEGARENHNQGRDR